MPDKAPVKNVSDRCLKFYIEKKIVPRRSPLGFIPAETFNFLYLFDGADR